MTTDTLRQMSHEALVAHVQRRITGQGGAGKAKPATNPAPRSTSHQNASTSTYARHPGVAPVKIASYPKRRPTAVPAARPVVRTVSAGRPFGADLCYADFFLSDQHAQLVAS
jgi:hypothetical protein